MTWDLRGDPDPLALVAVAALILVVGACTQAETTYQEVVDRQPPPTLEEATDVRVYHDPGGCQYLVLYEQYYGQPAGITPRQAAGSNGMCVRSER